MSAYGKIIAFGAICLFATLSTGCATITRGTTEVLVIETTPPGADVELSNGMRCRTPCSLEMKRKKEVVVEISKQGYEPVKVNVLSQIAGAGAAGMAGNVLLGGLIGAGVDAATGATKQLKPNPVKVSLVPVQQTAGKFVSENVSNAKEADSSSSLNDPPPADSSLTKEQALAEANKHCAEAGFGEETEDFRSCVLDQMWKNK